MTTSRPTYNRHLSLREAVKIPTMFSMPHQGPDSTAPQVVVAAATKTGLAALAGIFSYFEGFTTQLFWIVLGLMLIDAWLGTIAAWKRGDQLSATRLMHTLVKVMVYGLGFAAAGLVALAVHEVGLIFGVDLMQVSATLPWIALGLYAVNETISIGSHLRELQNPLAGLIEGAGETIGSVVHKRGKHEEDEEEPSQP